MAVVGRYIVFERFLLYFVIILDFLWMGLNLLYVF